MRKMKKKRWAARMISGFLSAVMVLSSAVTPMKVFASEKMPEEELKKYVASLPELDQVREVLDSDEIVTAKDYEIDYEAAIDLRTDFTGLDIPDRDKVNIKLYEVKNEDNTDFSTSRAGTYKAVYYVEPTNEQHPVYRISRNITVREPVTGTQPSTDGNESGEGGTSGDETEDAESDPDPDTSPGLIVEVPESADLEAAAETEIFPFINEFSEEAYAIEQAAVEETVQSMEESGITEEATAETVPETAKPEMTAQMEETESEASETDSTADETEVLSAMEEADNSTETPTSEEVEPAEEVSVPEEEPVFPEETEVTSISEESAENPSMTIISPEEMDEMIEEAETQDSFDEESGWTVSGVIQWAAEEEEIDLAGLGLGQTASFEIPKKGMLKAASSTQTVEITCGTNYYYADYGLGSYSTHKYTVKFGDVSATAYCVQPSRGAPGDGTFKITKLKDGKALAKVCYYGTKAAGDEGFFAEKYPDFSAGKRFVITHIAAAYANGSSDAFSGTNDTGRNLAMELYNYCQNMPNIPDVDMAFSEDTLKAYVEGNIQRTKVVSFNADELQTITFKLPAGVKLHNETTGKTSKAGAEVEINGGTKFYFSAPLTQATDVSLNWHAKMKGSVTKDFSAYKITTGDSTQDLALVFGEAVGTDEKYVEIDVTWVQKAKLTVVKTDASGKRNLAGAVFGVYSDAACTNLITQMPATDANGSSTVELDVTGTVYLKELTPPKRYRAMITSEGVTVSAGTTATKTIPNEEILGTLKVYKEGPALTGAVSDDNGTIFKYETAKLAGAKYSVTAGADIISANGTVVYKQGALVATLTTDKNGEAVLNNLTLGTYVITETSAPENYVNKVESKTVTLSEGSNSADAVVGTATFTNEHQKAKVSVVKQDDTTKNPLSGGVFGLYAGSDIKAADGTVVVKKDTFIEKVTTGADGSAMFTADIPLGSSYYVKELQAPKNYYRNQNDIYSFSFSYTDDKQAEVEFSHTFQNERVNARIDLVKVDVETGAPQGDAKLGKASYGLYARADIVHPDGKTGVLYKAGTQVATLTTDDEGKAHIEDLYLGKYFIKELIPSEGYLLDEKEYDLDCAYENDLVKTVKKEATSKEQVIKQPFQVIKAANNGKTDADLLKGVGFSAYLISSLKAKKDGSYDFAQAEPIILTADGKTEMFTDEKGHAVSIPIPYGKYIVRETTTPHNYNAVDDFIVTISENNPNKPQQWRVLLDDEFEAKLKIIKKDDETKKPVLLPKTEFKVYDMDHQKYVEQVTTYPSTVTHKSYFTDENGYLILPNNLKIGHYRIEEITAPNGYVLNHNAFEVLIDSNTAYQMDQASGDAIIEAVIENQPVKGMLTIKKAGEVLTSFDKDFGYEMTSLADAEFKLFAAEDIYSPDWQRDENGNRVLIYAKDALVTTVTTDVEGTAVVEDLPLGTYRIEETKAPFGYVLNKETQTVTFTYADQETPIIEQTAEYANDRQKVEISVMKQDAQTGKKLKGAVFGLYAASAIASADHEKVLVEAETLLEEATSDEDGRAAFTLDLPLGQYYVKEHKAPDGYVSSDEVLTFDADYQGQDVPTVQLTAEKKNEPTTFEFTKSDITTGVELDGAVLTVLTRKGDVIERWTSVKNEPHMLKCLTVGESYVLREEFAPFGYLRATDVIFTVEDTTKIQKVKMEDEVPTALLIINKKGEFLDKVSLLDNAKGTVEHMFEYISGNLAPVTFEVYAAEDIHAADGIAPDYYKKDDLVGTITTDDTGIAKMGDLPVGKYYVVEKATAYGYVLDNSPRFVDLSYRDQDTPIVVYDENWQNARQKVSVSLVKKEKGTQTPLKGAIFGLFTAEDIKSKDGKVLIEKDTLIEQKTTDVDGLIYFIADLPIDGKYYLQEVFAPNGYVNTGEKKEFTFTYEGSDKDLLSFSFTFENEPTTVELSKTDITNGKELPGAHLQVIDGNENVIDEWVSEEKPHIIQKLVVGREYELIETKPADGYVTAESVSFKVENTGEVQKVKMEDDVTKVSLSKSDITTGKEIPGAKLTILDEAGKPVETWISTQEPHYIEKLPIGKYSLREETAPAGYLVSEDVIFTVKDTGEIQKVVMKDDYTKVEISKQDITNSKEIPGAKLTIFDKDGKEVESWVSEEKPHYIEKLPVGEYTLREVTAPDGYEVAEDVKFKVEATGEIQHVVMKDAPKKQPETTPTTEKPTNPDNPTTPSTETPKKEVPTTPKTGDDRNPMIWLLLMLIGGSMLGGVWYLRKRSETDSSQK